MQPELNADELWVLSDLHLAPPGDQCVFNAHVPLVSLLNHITAGRNRSHVVLNGDVFDFLQLPGYSGISLPLAPGRMVALLDALDAEPAARNIVQAFRRLTAAGHGLHCLPGNHDPELNLTSVQQVLAERLCSSVALGPAEGCWRFRVARQSVVGMHGHHRDSFNAIPSAQMLKAQNDGDENVPMPPGSRLVCHVINPYRRARGADGVPRFPFVDLLPSEKAVVLALLLLDPRLAAKRLGDALGISASAVVRGLVQRLGPSSAKLSIGPADSTSGQVSSGGVLDSVAQAIAGAMTDFERAALLRVEAELESYLENDPAPTPGVAHLSAGAGGLARRLLLRALGAALIAGRDAFRPELPDPLASDTINSWGLEVIALTGHTHAAKQIAHWPGVVYINTGTWLDLVPLPNEANEEAVDDWLERLQHNRIPRWQGCPVAHVDASGAALLHWDGSALRPWAEGLRSVDWGGVGLSTEPIG